MNNLKIPEVKEKKEEEEEEEKEKETKDEETEEAQEEAEQELVRVKVQEKEVKLHKKAQKATVGSFRIAIIALLISAATLVFAILAYIAGIEPHMVRIENFYSEIVQMNKEILENSAIIVDEVSLLSAPELVVGVSSKVIEKEYTITPNYPYSIGIELQILNTTSKSINPRIALDLPDSLHLTGKPARLSINQGDFKDLDVTNAGIGMLRPNDEATIIYDTALGDNITAGDRLQIRGIVSGYDLEGTRITETVVDYAHINVVKEY